MLVWALLWDVVNLNLYSWWVILVRLPLWSWSRSWTTERYLAQHPKDLHPRRCNTQSSRAMDAESMTVSPFLNRQIQQPWAMQLARSLDCRFYWLGYPPFHVSTFQEWLKFAAKKQWWITMESGQSDDSDVQWCAALGREKPMSREIGSPSRHWLKLNGFGCLFKTKLPSSWPGYGRTGKPPTFHNLDDLNNNLSVLCLGQSDIPIRRVARVCVAICLQGRCRVVQLALFLTLAMVVVYRC